MRKSAPKKFRPTDRGLTHAYIGDGKGKTTAAVGVAVRALGYDWAILFLQFMKDPKWPSGERKVLRRLGIEVHVMGEGFYKILSDNKSPEVHKTAAAEALAFGRKSLFSGNYNLIIMDELGSAVEEGLLLRKDVESMLKDRASDKTAKDVHLIWTGHKKIPWMLKYCDLVTNMTMVKHPYYRGIIATRGIDY